MVIIIVAIIGFVLGFAQSLSAGLIAKSWSGGTGFLWGLIIGVLSGLSSFWIGWQPTWIAIALSIGVLFASVISIKGKRP